MSFADHSDIVDHLLSLFADRGSAWYSGEAVTQAEHALQAAWLAEQADGDDAMVAAALLHDVGHLVHDLGEDCAEGGVDDRHEEHGAAWLAEWFPPAVTEPIRLHVPAKRYRCAVDADYHARLSPASQLSLQLQGGPFTESECREFESLPHSTAAVRLREFDDTAKVQGLETPELDHFRPRLAACLAPRSD